MAQAGSLLERFLAPVEPGNLFMLAYKDDVPIISAPGCFRSAKPNVVDLGAAPMLARYRVSGFEVACLGHGVYWADPAHRRHRPTSERSVNAPLAGRASIHVDARPAFFWRTALRIL